MKLYKRNAQGKPIYWMINIDPDGANLIVDYGLVGGNGHTEYIATERDRRAEMLSLIKAKRKEGYKELQDLYDNAPEYLEGNSLWDYLNTYLPKFNTHEDGKFIPMLCKTLTDNKPFEKGNYYGQWKINGERCIITASKGNDLFGDIKLHYRSREGVDWTDKLSYLDDELLPALRKGWILDMMLEEGVGLDGELYLPGYGINEINSFIKNTDIPQHYKLQYWLYDLCMENMAYAYRAGILNRAFVNLIPKIYCKEDHLNITSRLNYLQDVTINNITEATHFRDNFIDLGFEGLVIREIHAEYQFGGKRNNSMLKYKKKLDGLFDILEVHPDKRGLPIFLMKNDLNDEVFECTLNAPQHVQKYYLDNKYDVRNKKGLVEYRERSGIKQVPFHAKLITIYI